MCIGMNYYYLCDLGQVAQSLCAQVAFIFKTEDKKCINMCKVLSVRTH